MPFLSELVEAMDDIDPATVDAQMPHLYLQHVKENTDFVFIGNPDALSGGAPRLYSAHRYIITRKSSFFRHFCQRPPEILPISAYGMGLENEDIQRLIDFMYVGIYGVDAIGFNWRLGRVPSVYINVRMYRMGVRFDMPSLVSFALEAIYRTFKIADRQDMEYAINDVWSTPDENEDLRAMLIHLDMDAMLSDRENLERWLGRTSKPYRHPA